MFRVSGPHNNNPNRIGINRGTNRYLLHSHIPPEFAGSRDLFPGPQLRDFNSTASLKPCPSQ